ncbi:MAG: hypothetical protein MUF83_14300 [Acidimicrobiales bacterium]|jgi:hypothetical protein|nr:hypothetical protein [Acidimicrobiales bacterium]
MATIEIRDLAPEDDDVVGFAFSPVGTNVFQTSYAPLSSPTFNTFGVAPLPGGRTTNIVGLMGVRG